MSGSDKREKGRETGKGTQRQKRSSIMLDSFLACRLDARIDQSECERRLCRSHTVVP
jgi:hypothetical protein